MLCWLFRQATARTSRDHWRFLLNQNLCLNLHRIHPEWSKIFRGTQENFFQNLRTTDIEECRYLWSHTPMSEIKTSVVFRILNSSLLVAIMWTYIAATFLRLKLSSARTVYRNAVYRNVWNFANFWNFANNAVYRNVRNFAKFRNIFAGLQRHFSLLLSAYFSLNGVYKKPERPKTNFQAT